ncbi:hypothetical protein N431DRAFT_517001 [Stipitochalara longipes BDJ]|nr:hypothetical protein N431DRAFT_517001 [Stipitochalara longipes BDJ]
MFIKAATVSALAAFAAAVPATGDTKTNYFTAISTRSGDQHVHLHQINASGQSFYINKGTSTDCPQIKDIDCSKYGNSTVFASHSDGALYMNVGVPGGQQVYVATGGALAYTAPHSSNIPDDGQAATFTYTPQASSGGVGTLVFDNKGFVACPTGDGSVFQIYAWTPKVDDAFRKDCKGIGFATSVYFGAAAWEFA